MGRKIRIGIFSLIASFITLAIYYYTNRAGWYTVSLFIIMFALIMILYDYIKSQKRKEDWNDKE